MEDIKVKRTLFLTLGKMKSKLFGDMIADYPELQSPDDTYSVFGMIKCLSEQVAKMRPQDRQSQKSVAMGEALLERNMLLDTDLKQEKLLDTRIRNQTKLGKLILKEEGEERVANVIKSLMNLVRNSIAMYAATQVDQRKVSKEQTQAWNQCLTLLEEEATIISWAEDGEKEVIATRVSKLWGEDEAEQE